MTPVEQRAQFREAVRQAAACAEVGQGIEVALASCGIAYRDLITALNDPDPELYRMTLQLMVLNAVGEARVNATKQAIAYARGRE